MHGYEVDLNEGSTQDFFVTFAGPKETIYEGAHYRVHVELPDQYPFASPSVGFEPYSIYHPNVDERSGSVCLDVINQTWTPLYSLINVFDVFLPQLLTYPNPSDPLNGDAASLYVKDPKKYEEKVKTYVAISVKRHEERQRQKENDEQEMQSLGGASRSNPDDLEEIFDDQDDGEIECAEFEMREDDNDDLDQEFD